MATLARLRLIAQRSPRYLAWRVVQEGRRETDRLLLDAARRGRGPLGERALSRLIGPEVLRTTREALTQLGAWSDAVDALRSDEAAAAQIRRRAGRAREGVVELFGEAPVTLERPLPWTSDPLSAWRFEDGFHRRLDYRLIDERCDVKRAWELSRLRVAVELAQGVALDGDQVARAALYGDLEDFRTANPVGFTVNWSVAMEVALRAVNLVCIDGLLCAAGAVDADRRQVVTDVYRHGWFLYRNLEVADLNGNHYLADAAGLVWLGRYFGGHGESARWMARGREMVRAAAEQQVLADGLDHEGSLPYHALVLELFLLCIHADPNIGKDVIAAVGGLTDALCAVAGPSGRIPDLGDDDGGRALALSDIPNHDARRVVALAAAVLGHGAAAAVAGTDPRVWEDAVWLRGPQSIKAALLASTGPPSLPVHLNVGGVVVLGAGDDRVVVDVGPVGFQGRGGHGHLDAMSFEAVLGGSLVVRDSGTGSYTGDAELRQVLRDAPAHSVVLVDGRRYASLGSVDLLWSITGDAPPRVLELSGDARGQRLVAEQTLPALAGEATWRRTIDWSPGRVRCVDEVRAPRGAAVRHHLQLAPGVSVPADPLLPEGARSTTETVPWSEAYGSRSTASRWLVEYEQQAEVETVAFELFD